MIEVIKPKVFYVKMGGDSELRVSDSVGETAVSSHSLVML